jgi:hypothetical protein
VASLKTVVLSILDSNEDFLDSAKLNSPSFEVLADLALDKADYFSFLNSSTSAIKYSYLNFEAFSPYSSENLLAAMASLIPYNFSITVAN